MAHDPDHDDSDIDAEGTSSEDSGDQAAPVFQFGEELTEEEFRDTFSLQDQALLSLERRIERRAERTIRRGLGGALPELTWEIFVKICANLAELGVKYKSCEMEGFRYDTVFLAIQREETLGNVAWSELWRESQQQFKDKVIAEVRDRGFNGVKKPVLFKGRLVGTVREKSDRMLELAARGFAPELFKERVEVSGGLDLTGGGLDILGELSFEAKKQVRAIIMADLKAQQEARAARGELEDNS